MRDATVTKGLRVFDGWEDNPTSWDGLEFSGNPDDALYAVYEVLDDYMDRAGWR